MKQTKLIFAIFLCIVAKCAVAQSMLSLRETDLTLWQCIDLAIQNNIEVKNSESAMQRDKIFLKQARENLLPTINTNSTYGITYGRGTTNAGITISSAESKAFYISANSNLVLSSGLSLINSIRQNALAYQAGKMDFQQIKDQITLNIVALYFTVLNSEDQLEHARMQLKGSKTNLDRLSLLNDVGSTALAEYYNIKGNYESDEVNVYNAETTVLTACINLFEVMNVPFKRKIRFARPDSTGATLSYGGNPDDIYNSGLNKLPQIKFTALKVQAAHKEVAVALGKYFPNLSIGVQIQSGYFSNSVQRTNTFGTQLQDNKLYGPLINLSIPILNYFQTKNNAKLAKLNLMVAQDNDRHAKFQLKQQIQQAYANMQNAYHRLHVFEAQVKTYESAYNVQKAKFDAGVITSDMFVIAKIILTVRILV